MSYLRAFLPWIVFAVIPGSQWQWAALIAVVISGVGIARQTAAGLPLDAQIIELGSAVYFAGLAALAFADPHTALHSYTASLASGALGLIGVVSLALRKPFTLGVAKQSTPRELWYHPVFIRVNVVITSVWTASFIVGCAALALLAHSSVLARSLVQTAAFAIPLIFTLRYVAQAQVRAEARAQANAPLHDPFAA
ncbi:MAG TPA: hypothetical protein VGZ32_25370 [Actinocrinis sp.]|uniref:hypothetical protein n=1 Tax=Actinocrinis sp. TaxID=1920516 RepID=UPI002DDD983E|nr:hypothetical protein [Actinocrinis sp.]HEV3173705.1 hypothetical protein [Actinocrinis sp.]